MAGQCPAENIHLPLFHGPPWSSPRQGAPITSLPPVTLVFPQQPSLGKERDPAYPREWVALSQRAPRRPQQTLWGLGICPLTPHSSTAAAA